MRKPAPAREDRALERAGRIDGHLREAIGGTLAHGASRCQLLRGVRLRSGCGQKPMCGRTETAETWRPIMAIGCSIVADRRDARRAHSRTTVLRDGDTAPPVYNASRRERAIRTRKMPDSCSAVRHFHDVSAIKQKLNCALFASSSLAPTLFNVRGLNGMSEIPKDFRVSRRPIQTTTGVVTEFLLRKEVIQPQVPLRLPCYDFIPVTAHTLGHCSPSQGQHTHFGYRRLP